MGKKIFTVQVDANYGTITLGHEVKASQITLKLYSVLAFDIAGAVANPSIRFSFRQISASCTDNLNGETGLTLPVDISKVHTVVPCDITVGLNSPLGRSFDFTVRDAVYGTPVVFAGEISSVWMTFEYDEV